MQCFVWFVATHFYSFNNFIYQVLSCNFTLLYRASAVHRSWSYYEVSVLCLRTLQCVMMKHQPLCRQLFLPTNWATQPSHGGQSGEQSCLTARGPRFDS